MHLTDEDLVAQCLSGDHDAFAALVRRYQAAVYATAFYYAGRYGGAEDVVQEAFWEAYRSLQKLKEPAHFGAWLKGVTTRVAANWLRRNISKQRNITPLPHRRTLSMEEARQGVEHDDYERVHRAIDALPERYRLPVVLRYMQELSYDEISRFTGDTRDEIRGMLSRANAMLREILSNPESQTGQGALPWQRVSK
ncbi:MAG TPA: sigma-70 family RNA polymerase sigma factor [Candidatus Hydrogenedentes bacterium]|nr:sigma-70 family RNA polymerase sigma factor [Candidatus Hydrogenedentota bacterium]